MRTIASVAHPLAVQLAARLALSTLLCVLAAPSRAQPTAPPEVVPAPAADVQGRAEHALADAVEEAPHVRVDCDGEPCGPAWRQRRLVALTSLDPTKQAPDAALARASANLLATGVFAAVEPHREGDVIVFACTSADLIREVRVRAGQSLGSELRRRVFLRAGQPWTADARVLERQKHEIEQTFERSGWFGSVVTIEPVAVKDAQRLVDLHIDVERGQRRTVDRVYLRGADAISYEAAREAIVGEFNLLRHFTSERFERAQRALLRLYRRDGYIQARVVRDEVRHDPRRGTVDIFIEVREGPQWNIVVSGNTAFSRQRILDATSFHGTGFVDDAEIAVAAAEIRRLYETAGYAFAEVSTEWVTAADGTETLTFNIDERYTAEIRQIVLNGVHGVRETELRDRMGTVEYDILSVGGYLQRGRLASDLDTIRAYYREQGFLAANVPRVTLVGENEGRDLFVYMDIEEGERTWLTGIDDEGVPDDVGRTRARREALPRPLSLDALRSAQAQLTADLHRAGYAYAEVTTECYVDGAAEPVPCVAPDVAPERRPMNTAGAALTCSRAVRRGAFVEECMLLRPALDTTDAPAIRGSEVRVVQRVAPGRQITAGVAFVQGNFETRRAAIERELRLRRGAPFDYQELLESQARLRSLGLFDSVRIASVGADAGPDSGDEAHVIVQVEEAGSRTLEHRVGLEARGLTGGPLLILSNEPTFRETNLLGRARELRVLGNFDLDVLDAQRVVDREFAAGAAAQYRAPRFYFSRRSRNAFELTTTVGYSYDLLAVAPAPLTRALSLDARLRDRAERVEGLFLEAVLQLKQAWTIDQTDPTIVSSGFDPALILSIAPRLTLDRRDNPLNPTRGFVVSADVELADDFLGVLNAEKYTKATLRGSGFVPLGGRFVLGLNARWGIGTGGIAAGFRSTRALALPVSERFSLGGVSSLRGFADGGVPSRATDAFGGDHVVNWNVELRYPFLRDFDVQGAVFIDGGQLLVDASDFDPRDFRMTAGFGLRWILADVLPVLIDYGAVLNRRTGDRAGRAHFNIGYTF